MADQPVINSDHIIISILMNIIGGLLIAAFPDQDTEERKGIFIRLSTRVNAELGKKNLPCLTTKILEDLLTHLSEMV